MMAPIAAHRRDTALHRVDLGLERGGRGIALPAVRISGLPALEYRGEVPHVAVAVGNRVVHGFVQRAVLDR